MTNCDVQLDFEAPLDYNSDEEREKTRKEKEKNAKINEQLSKEEIAKMIQTDKFKGGFTRLDGKEVTTNLIKRFEKDKKEEKTYNPRECKIERLEVVW